MRHEHAFLPAEPYLLSVTSSDACVEGLGVGEGDERMGVIVGEGLDEEGGWRHCVTVAYGDGRMTRRCGLVLIDLNRDLGGCSARMQMQGL